MDSQACTCCIGNECQVLYEIGQADVTGFHQDLGQIKGAKIVTAAMAYDNQENGDTYLLIFNQASFLPGLDHHLINPFQLRDNGIFVNDIPLIHTNIEDRTTSTHSTTVLSVNLQIPLQLNRVLSGFKARKPTNREINDLYSDSVTMTADSPEWYPMDSRYQVEEKEMRKDLNEDLNHNPRDRRIQFIHSNINQNKQIIPRVHFDADLQYCSISHKQKGTVSPDQLVKRWNIGIETARWTYEATTQLGVRAFVETKGTKQLKHTSYQLKH